MRQRCALDGLLRGGSYILDLFDAFRALSLTLVIEDEAGAFAVWGHEEVHADLEILCLEGIGRQEEEVIVLGVVECPSHVDQRADDRVQLVDECMEGALQRQSQRLHCFQIRYHGVYLVDDLRGDRVDDRKTLHRVPELVSYRVDGVGGL